MARKAHRKDPLPAGLPKLPNEILLEIVSLLSISDLRRLDRVNRKLHFFIGDYLVRYRYNAGLFTLPNELILEIVQHLGRQKDRSRLARASQRFYPLIMDYISRHNVRYGGSSLLNYAAKRDLKGMARMILHLGGDVDTQCGFRRGVLDNRVTPLVIAAFHGHEKMVRMLLEAGASVFVDGMRIPLAMAIHKRHEKVALILSQELDFDDVPLTKTGDTALQMACGAKLVDLVRYYLECGSRCGGRVNVHSLPDRSTALHHVLRKDASKDVFFKRELHEDVYQIVVMLLHHGANPDILIKVGVLHPVTARAIASRHPDPRLRILLSKATPATEPKESALLIGRPWMVSSDDKAPTFYESQSGASSSEDSCYARLRDFLRSSNAEPPNLMDKDGTEYRGENYEDFTLNASDIADLVEGEMQRLNKRSKPMEPPPLLSFPQLGIPK
jgi:ankyrin repeat protein